MVPNEAEPVTEPGQYRKLVEQPEFEFFRTLNGIFNHGEELDRPFTDAERLLIALLASPPTNMLTLQGSQDGPSMDRAWPLFDKRIDRARTNPRPLTYLGTKAQGLGDGGEHIHLLTWDYLLAGSLVKHCRKVGIGSPRIKQISHRDDPVLLARPIAYVLGQHESIFGTDEHKRHKPRKKHARRWLLQHRSTLAEHNPKLLSAVQAAESQSVSDKDLVQMIPYFSRGIHGG